MSKVERCPECLEMRAAHGRMVDAYARGDIEAGNFERDRIMELGLKKAKEYATNAGKFLLPNIKGR